MSTRTPRLNSAINFVNTLSLAASIALVAAMSIEVTQGNRADFSGWYRGLQLCVCIIFLLTATFRLCISELRQQHYLRDTIFALISIPYINILHWAHLSLPTEVMRIIAFAPVIVSIMATGIIIEWLIEGRKKRLMAAYILTVILFTYISALIFYDYEIHTNTALHGFGDAVWWAWMNVTTVGAPFPPVTTIGKVVCVALPIVGMLFFPILTIYISDFYDRKGGKEA
ncbi:MAG: two pore domain potassium channel family protein [Alistipes sp.]|nr:two pore domain potassium channel family protein [Alistipes sp.]